MSRNNATELTDKINKTIQSQTSQLERYNLQQNDI